MSQTLYVGNVSYQSTDESLATAFGQAGTVVSAKIVMDKFTGRSRGFAFVDMDTAESAQKAIDLLNGKDLDGRELRVSLARPKEDRPPRRDFRN
ncbi:MAG: RNA-binding protein [Candidatus Magasanikbacteria bacterium RIFCSPHIGHO2_01_FULL_41_23]|uniref:RNA-binding protein n=1 Tax=Candidatus Magasanikbacteria bacterium RIFCSPLOWO2_01_FULL_40_15 TaxID=1798686 RepID=A0A1F6N3G8_9BACT|nr:MAG: RNA-binding protein [Candidatus Magasanikbacteria bacterium RIFCSPHIGHO2_01_FULL_41_23]OGH66967.1 MAG: RNA-binding protein [Candidatus Magasanikbacteria bacterium RIFCSPHIGHO2_02_FULL_41_35]OGH74948.1 MAG: RNA-binding protein [Candidatus Magasanikbacteria bacterium RIFCSPHIGHO2_12_FULL_41_16]OGH78250.1 MAG: RNA-binding protein [Candidatus Magasanikbacteria bacterium RIFCSPLOWO2_01_FULL_40_15]